MTLRRTILISCALIIIPGMLYAGFWWFLARHIEQSFEQWVDNRRSNGWDIQWAGKKIAGFPGAVYLSVQQPQIRLPGGLSWHSEQVGVKISPRHTDQLRMAISGTHHITWQGRQWQLSMADGRLITQINDQGTLGSATIQAHRLSVHDGKDVPLTVKELALTWDPSEEAQTAQSEPLVDFSATAHDVAVTGTLPLPLDGKISLVAVDGQVRGEIPFLDGGMDWRGWSQKGGVVDVKHAAIEWHPMAFSASGTCSLDGNGQVVASFLGRLRGFDPLLDRLKEGGSLSPDMAMAAKAMFALMSRPDPQGRPSISVPMTVQGGILSLGSTPIGHVPPLSW